MSTTAEIAPFEGIFVDNQWRPAHATEVMEAVCAATEEPIGRFPVADAVDVDRAVASARAAFDDPTGWSAWPPEQRAAALEALADAMDKRAEAVATTVSTENGMPITVANASEGVFPSGLLRYYAALSREFSLEAERRGPTGARTVVRYEPVGVVGAIAPWNYPQTLASFKYAPALAAGCTLVLKPSPVTTLNAALLADAVRDAGLPPGVLTIVPGGAQTGIALVDHPGVDQVAFTGSSAAGRAVAQRCAARLRRATLELGGKSAAVVLDDADLAGNLEAFFLATLLNTGQTCYLGTRILAPRSRYEEVVQTVAALVSSLAVGDPMDPATQVGPVACAAQRAKVESAIAQARSDGFRVVTGGGRPAGLERGYYVEPTVFADVDNASPLAREDIFGPVLAITPYAGDDEAVELANDSDYGLGGSVWSADPQRAFEVARRIRTGSIGINGYWLDVAAPFGGVKDSGMGRELGPEGFTAYLVTKSIYDLSS